MRKRVRRPKLNVRPRVVVRAFRRFVHQRTVFRWMERGHLPSSNGLVDRAAVLKALKLWKQTCSKGEAQKRLQVMAATIAAWKKKEILKAEKVCGVERIYKDSVDGVLEVPNFKPGTKRPLFNSPARAEQRRLRAEKKVAEEAARLAEAQRRQEFEEIITADDAAKILRLPVWQALPILHKHVQKTEVNGNIFFSKRSVENCAFEHFELFSRLRITGRGW